MSIEKLVPRANGNTVELRIVGKHKWLFINGVHIARVAATSLDFSADSTPQFTVTFAVDDIIGFDTIRS